MKIIDRYRQIYFDEIVSKCKGIILEYSPTANTHEFHPFSHGAGPHAVEQLGRIMRQNLLFYCYGEEEIVSHYEQGTFSNLEEAAQHAYEWRLPKRSLTSDGLPGEVLLDLLVQLYAPAPFKLAVRPMLRQFDNNEIKGYDLAYFTLSDKGEIALWLGQAKLGDKMYCKTGIHTDLVKKFAEDYFSTQLFFVCDKPAGTTPEAKTLSSIINKINIANAKETDTIRQAALMKCFAEYHISVYIPCLLAYGAECVYKDPSEICAQIEQESSEMQSYFLSHKYTFSGFAPHILFYIFPIEDIARLRDKGSGFYAGLRK